jgi:hypothetical protein
MQQKYTAEDDFDLLLKLNEMFKLCKGEVAIPAN